MTISNDSSTNINASPQSSKFQMKPNQKESLINFLLIEIRQRFYENRESNNKCLFNLSKTRNLNFPLFNLEIRNK